ncbi:MarR family transcriptional regulator [Sandaracinobacter sp. RS1-74]|uniref:MarR family winged helix-turn-helix transcriptional regulator n=1 Tax=Sandaracinobacteroides sayramensis TaxID=2913411 RepID=UPI001EDAB48F|nr:MarR family transcriptional regulator [Sandaracinobacteroides sayramensis]MCG2840626.1 MarR family transcriptional regulator [Sandaracinobacteroides sayramensis]
MSSDDRVEARRRQWAEEMPGLDTSGMAILGRARVITLSVRPAIEKVFDSQGLDTGDFDVLSTLLRSGPPYRLRPTELFRWLMITSGGLTARLSRLEKRGLVERVPDPADGRSLLVGLSADGLEKARAAIVEDMRTEADLLDGLSAKERETLAELLRKLALSLESKGL